MKCSFCGAEIADNALFCVICGEIVGQTNGRKVQKVNLNKSKDDAMELMEDYFDDNSDVTLSVLDFENRFPPSESEPMSEDGASEIESEGSEEPTFVPQEEMKPVVAPPITGETFAAPRSNAPTPSAAPLPNAPTPSAAPRSNAPMPSAAPRSNAPMPSAAPQPNAPTPSAASQPNAPMPSAAPRSNAPTPSAAPRSNAPTPSAAPRPNTPMPSATPWQNVPVQPDINAMRNSVINGFAYRHYNKLDYFGPVEGMQKTFPLFNHCIVITPDKDVFNTYRLQFRNLALKYTEKFIKEYSLLVINLETFLQYFPAIYFSNMEFLINTAMDVLAAENVWTQSFNSLYMRHKADYHAAMDIFNAISWSGANIAVLNVAQRAELYRRVVPSTLFQNVYLDYWKVFLTLVFQLRASGKNIWWGTKEMAANADNMFRNLSNPRFPKEKTHELILQIIALYPYNKPMFYQLTKQFGDTPEISAIRHYFGYTDMSNPRII